MLIFISQESKIFPKNLSLIPNRHPLICLALELDHMATPNCQGGKWGCFWVASNNICCSSQSGYSSPGIHLALVLLETRTCEPQTYNKGSATCFQASVLLATCLGFYPLLWQDLWLLLQEIDWTDSHRLAWLHHQSTHSMSNAWLDTLSVPPWPWAPILMLRDNLAFQS